MSKTELVMVGAGAALVFYLLARQGVKNAAAAVEETRQDAALSLSDWWAEVTGLADRERELLGIE